MITKADIVTKSNARSSAVPAANKVSAEDINELKRVTDSLVDDALGSADGFVVVSTAAGFPAAVDGVITLADDVTYYIVGDVDLAGSRLVGGQNTTLIGGSSETTSLISTGLASALITSQYSLAMRHLTITASVALALSGAGGANVALDWTGVNFLNCPTIGTIDGTANFTLFNSAFLESGNLTLTGTIGTIAISQCLFSPAAGQTALILPASLTITRRLRVIYSSFIATSGETALNVSTTATIPDEGYILDTVNFAGGGTYLTGVQSDDDKALFSGCRGIVNSTSIVNIFMKNNATETVVTTSGDRYAVLGTTTAGAIIQRFTLVQAENSARYDSTIKRTFKAQAALSLTAPNNNVIGIYLAIARSGAAVSPDADRITESEVYITTNGARPDTAFIQALVQLEEGDRVYCIVQNTSGTGNITVNFLNLIITEQA